MGRVADLESSRGLVAGLSTAASLMGIVVLALWAVAAASDFGTGWIRVMVQAEPRRWALLAGKVVTLTLLTLVGALIATGVAVAPDRRAGRPASSPTPGGRMRPPPS